MYQVYLVGYLVHVVFAPPHPPALSVLGSVTIQNASVVFCNDGLNSDDAGLRSNLITIAVETDCQWTMIVYGFNPIPGRDHERVNRNRIPRASI